MKKIILVSLFCFGAILLSTNAFAATPPVVNAGPDLYATINQSVILQGSASDATGSSLTYLWNCNGGSLSTSNISQPIFTIPGYGVLGFYTCTLTATNNQNLSNSDTVNIYTTTAPAVGGNSVQTNSASNISSTQTTLNGYISAPSPNGNLYGASTVWFQYGPTSNYGSETAHQIQNASGTFTQNLVNLAPNSTFHFRAVAQTSNTIIYGQDLAFTTLTSGGYYGTATLTTTKKVINLTNGNLNWQTLVSANPGDILSFAVTLQAGSQDIHNVTIYDILPANLIYKGNLTINAAQNYSSSIANGINIGTITANNICVVAFQVQVAPASNFIYGNTTINIPATITSTETGSQTASATVVVNNSSVYGATTIATGITNNPITDSFLFPIFLIVLASYLYFSGKIYTFADWLATKIK